MWNKLKYLFLPSVFKSYSKYELIQLPKAVAFLDFPADPDFESESINECF